MEVELKNIIDRIKAEGVEEAEKEAKDIKEKASAEAGRIKKEAEKEAEDIKEKASAEADRTKANAEAAIRQAARDALLGLRGNILEMFDKVIAGTVSEQLSPEVIKEMLIKMVEALSQKEDFDLEVLLSEEDRKTIERTLEAELKERFNKGVTLKSSPHLEKGFRIGEKGGNAYYDFSDEAIEEAFRAYLNPRMTALLSPKEQKEQ